MAAKVKELRMKQADGTWSTGVPIGADAANVSFQSGKNLEQTVSDMQSQIDALNSGGLTLKDDVIGAKVTSWLDEHPDATTTVEDGTITEDKLARPLFTEVDGLKEDLRSITNSLDKRLAIQESKNGSYLTLNDAVTQPITQISLYGKEGVATTNPCIISGAYGLVGDTETGGIDIDTGVNTNTQEEHFRTKGFIKVIPNTTYYVKLFNNPTTTSIRPIIWVIGYDSDYTAIQDGTPYKAVVAQLNIYTYNTNDIIPFITTSTTEYIRMYINTGEVGDFRQYIYISEQNIGDNISYSHYLSSSNYTLRALNGVYDELMIRSDGTGYFIQRIDNDGLSILSTPINIRLSASEVYAICGSLKTYAENTGIYNASNLAMEIKYQVDLKAYIDKKIKELIPSNS